VHLAAKGWPIVGDSVYGRARAIAGSPRLLDRQALHAWRIAFAQPTTGAWVEVTAPLPLDMAKLASDWRPQLNLMMR
jgi:23S rRNA pseudouridine1911/1915/1917 synthase